MEEYKVCRLCLNSSLKLHSMVHDNYLDMFEGLTGIKVLKEEYLETCIKCLIDLKLAYKIQQGFIDSYNKFTEYGFSFNGTGNVTNAIDSSVCQVDITETKINSEFNTTSEIEIKSDYDIDNSSNAEFILIESRNDDESDLAQMCRCYICGSSFKSDPELYTHIKEHYDINANCEFCETELSSITLYREHLQIHHRDAELNTWQCKECQLSFQYKPLFNLHISSIHNEGNKGLPNLVEKQYNKRNKLTKKKMTSSRERSRWNKPAEPFSVTCQCCNKVYTCKRNYNSHMLGSQKKQCPICDKRITSYNLSKHIMMHSSAPMVCHLCGATCKNVESLRGHLYYTHSQRQYPCEHCGKVFKKKYGYVMHVKKEHTGEKSFVCDTCGKKFFTQYTLNCHTRTTHLKQRKHICSYCQKAFCSRFGLKTHERQHTNETPFVCDVCGEAFRQKVSLKSHRKSKHNIVEKATLECKECGRMFASDSAIKSHMRLHL